MREKNVVLQLNVADLEHGHVEEFHDVENRTGYVKDEIDRSDDDEHARDLVDQFHLSS